MKLFMLLLFCPAVFAERHSLKYFITASSGNPNISEFMGVGMVDGVEAGYCDLRNRILEIKQDWAKKIVDKDPRQLQYYTHVCFENLPPFFTDTMSTVKQDFNQTGGVHFLQRIDGCEWDETTGKVTGLTRFGYDGEDFIELDLKTLTWIALKPEAVNTKIRWDAERADLRNAQYFLNVVCPTWLKTVWNTERSSLQRKVLPSVSLLQKTPSSPISCHATGFYPGRAVMFWRKGGEEIHEDVYLGEILPNNDETFQMNADLSILSVTPEDWGRYDCVFQLSGGVDIITNLNESIIRTNWKGESHFDTPIPIIVAVGAVVMLIAAVGFVVYKKKVAARPERGICCWRRAPEPEQCALESATSYKLCLIVSK